MRKFNLKSLFKKQSSPDFQYSRLEYVSSIAELPKELGDSIFIVKRGKIDRWVVFKCPNNCGNRVEVNLMKNQYPFWRLKVKGNKVTLSPSIIVEGCNAHFWLTESRVEWFKFENKDYYERANDKH